MKRPIWIIWCVGILSMIVICWFLWLTGEDISLKDSNVPPNRVRSYGTLKYVTDIRLGWCNNDGQIIEHNFFTDSLSLTVFLQNFDGWLLTQAHLNQRLLPDDLKPDDLANYLSLVEIGRASCRERVYGWDLLLA